MWKTAHQNKKLQKLKATSTKKDIRFSVCIQQQHRTTHRNRWGAHSGNRTVIGTCRLGSSISWSCRQEKGKNHKIHLGTFSLKILTQSVDGNSGGCSDHYLHGNLDEAGMSLKVLLGLWAGLRAIDYGVLLVCQLEPPVIGVGEDKTTFANETWATWEKQLQKTSGCSLNSDIWLDIAKALLFSSHRNLCWPWCRSTL